MVTELLGKLFGSKRKVDPQSNGETSAAKSSGDGSVDLVAFVDFVVRSLVTERDDVKIETGKEGDGDVIKITCAKDDIRKIIGKNGRTINAIRGLVRGAGKRTNKNMNVVICE